MKILLVTPPHLIDEEDEIIIPQKAMLPIGVLSIAAKFKSLFHNVQYVDMVFSSNWQEQLDEKSYPHIILISCHTTRNMESCKQVINKMRLNWTNAYIVLGGNSTVQLCYHDFRQLGLDVDAVVHGYGHGQDVIEKILNMIKGDILPMRIEHLPVPALELVDNETHLSYLVASGGRYPIIGHGLGCPWTCKYCTANMGARWTPRPIGLVEQEVMLAKKFGYKELFCVDNVVLVDPTATLAFDALVVKNKMVWTGMSRPEQVVKNPQVFGGFQALTGLAMGIESSSGNQLKGLGRGSQSNYFETCKQAFKIINDVGIESTAFVILDLPGSTEVDFCNLLETLKICEPTSVSWSFYNPSATEVLFNDLQPGQFGFYRWPMSFSKIKPERIVQQAMIISGLYWLGWKLNSDRPFFQNKRHFGVRFEEGTIYQPYGAISPAGDSWEMWLQNEGGE